MKSVHCDTLVCGLILFLAELRLAWGLAVGNEAIDIKFPSFPEDDHFMVFGDAKYNPARQSYILNAAARKQATGGCGELVLEQEVRILEVATGRMASFSTSVSFNFTTYGEPWDATAENPRSGSGLGFIFASSRPQPWMQDGHWQFDAFNSCADSRTENGVVNAGGFGLLINTEYAPYRGVYSNNYIEIMKTFDYEIGNPSYSHNLCGHNRTHCSYFSNGRVFTAWMDFSSSSKTLEVRLANGSQPNVTKPLQPLLRIHRGLILRSLC